MYSEKQELNLGNQHVKLISISTQQRRIFLLVKGGERK
jgi:hypothetical protein